MRTYRHGIGSVSSGRKGNRRKPSSRGSGINSDRLETEGTAIVREGTRQIPVMDGGGYA